MSVYVRTTAGTAAALNPLSKLPRSLRQLLVALDGSTPRSDYAARMASPGDMGVMLEALLKHGLIREADSAGAQYGEAPGGNTPPPLAIVALASSNRVSDRERPVHNQVPDVQIAPGQAIEPFDVDTLPSAFWAESIEGLGSQAVRLVSHPDPAAQYALRDLILKMSDFVMQHLPDQSLEIVLTLEGLATKEQVLSSLGDYHAIIAPTGEVANRHLTELMRMLDRI